MLRNQRNALRGLCRGFFLSFVGISIHLQQEPTQTIEYIMFPMK